jgi:hypothetical protein
MLLGGVGKPFKTASGGVSGVLLIWLLRTDKVVPASLGGVRIFFMMSPSDGVEKQ